MNTQDLTILFQGPLPDYDLRYAADDLRKHFPGCKVILSTASHIPSASANFRRAFDKVVEIEDVGSLPTLKSTNPFQNNINRQITSSFAGIEATQTSMCLRMRADMTVRTPRILDLWQGTVGIPRGPTAVGKGRLIVSSLFTLNPAFEERFPYHIGDMMQFGFTEDLLRYYSAPLYDWANATWYEHHPHAPHTNHREVHFRSRYAVEQWLAMNYLFPSDFPIQYHNHISPEIIAEFEEYLVDNFVVFHPRDMDIRHPKFDWARDASYFNAVCYSFGDWSDALKARRGFAPDLEFDRAWPSTPSDRSAYFRAENRTGWTRKAAKMLPRSVKSAIVKRLR